MRRVRWLTPVVLVSLILALVGADAARAHPLPSGIVSVSATWQWPIDPVRLVAPYVQPAHHYGPGHRGIDLAAPAGSIVRSPAHGVVAFAGTIAGRGVVTIDHGDGLVTTLEPVDSDLVPGTAIARGEPVGIAAEGGHAPHGSVHFGVRLHGEYINPLVLLGGVPRAVLLPCCD